jgi:arsenate reductase
MVNDNSRMLILCTGNSCRSQMAEGFFRRRLLELGLQTAAAAVCSAGLETHGLNPRAVHVMAEAGVDISHHRSTDLREYLNEEFDYVITVCDNAAERCPVFPGPGIRLHWPFDDPAGAEGSEDQVLEVFRRVRDEIRQQIEQWLEYNVAADQRP